MAPSGVYRNFDGRWGRSSAPTEATQGVALCSGLGAALLLGRDRLFSSDDGGARFAAVAIADDAAGFETLALIRQPSETLFAIAHGRLLASTNGGKRWQQRPVGDTSEPIETVIADPTVPGRVWVAAANRLKVSSDAGVNWQAVGSVLPEAHTVVRGIAADPNGATLVVTTHRGTYRSTDAGVHWGLEEGNLPVHLEAGPLARDPANPGVLYIVYSLIPYPEVWRSALEGSNLLARVDPMDLLGGLAFLLLLSLGSTMLVVWLLRQRRDMQARRGEPHPPTPAVELAAFAGGGGGHPCGPSRRGRLYRPASKRPRAAFRRIRGNGRRQDADGRCGGPGRLGVVQHRPKRRDRPVARRTHRIPADRHQVD